MTIRLNQLLNPKSVKHVQSFLGLTGYYRKFIRDYSLIAKPLPDMLRKHAKFKFDYKEREAFEKLKAALCNKFVPKLQEILNSMTQRAIGKSPLAILIEVKMRLKDDLEITRLLDEARVNDFENTPNKTYKRYNQKTDELTICDGNQDQPIKWETWWLLSKLK